jgi:phage replication-related protein YjqB (UPF0714/DUF867 family)
MSDKYHNFQELIDHEKEGADFKIELVDRKSQIAVIAIHGGDIEPGTTEIAKALAEDSLSFYSFIGVKKTEEENDNLHVTSSAFDEPRCLDLVSKSNKIISIHGAKGDDNFLMLGGLDQESIRRLVDALKKGGYEIRQAGENLNGDSPENICNRCLSGKGIQLEISRGLRDLLKNNPEELSKFCGIIRSSIVIK